MQHQGPRRPEYHADDDVPLDITKEGLNDDHDEDMSLSNHCFFVCSFFSCSHRAREAKTSTVTEDETQQ